MTQMQRTDFIPFGVRLLSVVYLGLGVLGFLPIEVLNPLHPLGVGTRYLLNLIAINPLHNLIHLTIGLSGLWAARTLPGARLWGKVVGAVLLFVFLAGMAQAILEGLPSDQLLLGLVSLNSPGHVLHLLSGGLALYLGTAKPPSQPA